MTEQQLGYEELEAAAAEARRKEELALEKYRKQTEEEQLRIDQRLEELEIGRFNQLAAQQTAYQEAQKTDYGILFSGPSLFKYAIIFLFFAIPNDAIDLIDFTGIGIFFSWFVSAFLSVTTLIIMWFSDSELKRVKGHMSNIDKYKKAAAKTITKTAAKLTKFAPRNPILKVIAGTILEMIPVISVLPWSSISVYLAYADERKTFKEAREILGTDGGSSQLPETVPEMV
jgi:hypothetical protein